MLNYNLKSIGKETDPTCLLEPVPGEAMGICPSEDVSLTRDPPCLFLSKLDTHFTDHEGIKVCVHRAHS